MSKSDTIVEISENANAILALVQAADKLQEKMNGIKEQTAKLDQEYNELLLMRDALHTKAKQLYHQR